MCRFVSLGHADKSSFGASFCARWRGAERRIGRGSELLPICPGAALLDATSAPGTALLGRGGGLSAHLTADLGGIWVGAQLAAARVLQVSPAWESFGGRYCVNS